MAAERVVHCWTSRLDDIEYLSDEYIAYFVKGEESGTCLLLDGHEGPHVFTPNREIRVQFSEQEVPDGN